MALHGGIGDGASMARGLVVLEDDRPIEVLDHSGLPKTLRTACSPAMRRSISSYVL